MLDLIHLDVLKYILHLYLDYEIDIYHLSILFPHIKIPTVQLKRHLYIKRFENLKYTYIDNNLILEESYYLNNIKEYENRYNRDNANGLCISWHNNAIINELCNYRNANKDGEYISYHPNAIRFKQHNYKNGLLDGDCICYDQNGNMRKLGYYKNGIINQNLSYGNFGIEDSKNRTLIPL